ncbi:MAG: hypothetical protein BHW01_04775 [Clostridium sp. 27_14]|jgi:hypothetical protein|nr:MAG: hypothetical protein BHW01_04775 [Clostridium sp. 27_14]
MIVKYNRLGYLIGEGFSNVFKNKKSTMASIIIMCATMIIFGLFLIIGENVNHFVDNLKLQQGFQVFMKEDATQEEMDKVKEDIRALDGISTIEFVSKEQGLNTMKEKLKDEKGVLDGFNVQKIKASYIVKVTDLERSKTIQSEVEKIDNVVKITNSNETAMKLISIAKVIRIATGVILLLLIIISTFIISNTIKLTVHSRRKEISIMKYVGATNSFIRWPFIVEGIVIGIISSIISIIIVGGTYNIITTKMAESDFVRVMGMNLVGLNEMLTSIILVYLILGIGIGTVGSVVSMRKYLKV